MKKMYIVLLLLTLLIPFNVFAKEKVKLHLFYSDTCPHCHSEIEYLNEIDDKYDNLEISYYERNDHSELLKEVRKKLEIDNSYVPLTVVGSDYVIGFNDETKNQIEDMIKAYQDNEHCDLVNNLDDKECRKKNDGIYSESEVKEVPILGNVNVKETSLFLISMVIGFVDGFNPCAMWVLIFIISLLIDMKDKKRMLFLGLTFIISSAIVYLFFMLSWLQITNTLMSTWFRYIIAIVAFIAGFISIKNYIKTLKDPVGCTVTNKEDRKKIVTKAKKIIGENKLFLAFVGIIGLAFSVNLIELACSAGLPTFFITILKMNELSSLQYMLYILIYIFFFMLDDIIIFLIATLTFKIKAISNKYSKYSHLIGGIICIIIAILLAFFPNIIMFNF